MWQLSQKWRPVLAMLCIVPAQTGSDTELNSGFFKGCFFVDDNILAITQNIETQVKDNRVEGRGASWF